MHNLVSTESGLLAIVGVAHGTQSSGKILRVHRKHDGQWIAETLTDLGHAPEVVVKDTDGSLIVATTERLLRYYPITNKTEMLLDHVAWGILLPNSMVVDQSSTIWIGMRHGIAKVEKKAGSCKLSWLLPDKNFR